MTSLNQILIFRSAAQTLKERFPDGLELGSYEVDRFIKFFGEKYHNSAFLKTLDAAKAERLLRKVGVVLDGKVYVDYPSWINNVVLSPQTTRCVSVVIARYFPAGLNIESTEQLSAFWKAAIEVGEKYPVEGDAFLSEFMQIKRNAGLTANADNVVLSRMIEKIVAPFKGVVYPVSIATLRLIEENVVQLFADGCKLVYYSVFFERNSKLLTEKKFVSAEHFQHWISKVNSRLIRKSLYFESAENDALEEEKIREEIERVLPMERGKTGEELILALVERLYIPEEKIREAFELDPRLLHIIDEDEDEEEDEEEETTSPSKPYDLREALLETLAERYPNGFPLNSMIELRRLRRLTGEKIDNIENYTNDRIQMILYRDGSVFEGKVYILSQELNEFVRNQIQQAFEAGASLIYFEPLFQKLRFDLPDFFSVELLRSRVKFLFRDACSITDEYCERRRFEGFLSNASERTLEESKIVKEIKRVWGDGTVLSSDELVERLPLVPAEKINAVLKRGSDFERNVKDTYVRLDQIEVEEEERRAAKEYVAREVGLNDFVSLENVPVGNMSLRYEEVELNCLQRILFKDCLDAKYQLRGRVVTLKGLGYNAKDLIKKMCRKEPRVSLDQLIEWEQELTGKSTYVYALGAAYETMIRTSQEEFVDDKLVSFDVEEIDKRIDELMGEQEYLPLSDFVSFTTYPNPGVAWSKFLLESFCQPRFSRKFALVNTIPNSSNVGVILRKESAMGYDEIIEDAVLSSDVPLTKDSVLNFLTARGYIGQKRYSKIEELLKKAKIARLEKENR